MTKAKYMWLKAVVIHLTTLPIFWTLPSSFDVLLPYEGGFCYNTILKTLEGVGRRYCATVFSQSIQLYGTQADAMLYYADVK